MSKQLMHPLQALVKKAAAALPTETGKVAVQQRRIERRAGGTVILADVSASMQLPAWGGLRKIDALRQAVAAVRKQRQSTLIAFSAQARIVAAVPEPEANTDLVAGLRAAQGQDPGLTLVISDGQPDNPAAALALAASFRGAIDVLYVGPESDAAAIAFMRRLANAAGGTITINDIATRGGMLQLQRAIAGMLPAPIRPMRS